jgi:apolipoprotein D and lipocalin family protein
MRILLRSSLIIAGLTLIACSSTRTRPPLQTVPQVDMQRYMGKWYVLAHIPTAIEKGAFNAVESYRLNDAGEIETTFTFNQGSFDGPLKAYHPKGFIRNQTSHAEWGMQFIWPIKAEYLITHLDQNYTQTIVARDKRDYVWIMARTPQISESEYTALTETVRSYGYDMTRFRKIPQRWQ